MKFRECGELLRGRKFSLRKKGMVYRSCARSAMLYGSEPWGLRETEMAILKELKEKLVDKKKMEDLMEMLGLKETLDRMAKANGVRWYGRVIRRDDDNILKAMIIEVNGERKRGRPKMTWEAGGRERDKNRVSWRSNETEGRCESDHGGDEVYRATFGNEGKTGLKLDRRKRDDSLMNNSKSVHNLYEY